MKKMFKLQVIGGNTSDVRKPHQSGVTREAILIVFIVSSSAGA